MIAARLEALISDLPFPIPFMRFSTPKRPLLSGGLLLLLWLFVGLLPASAVHLLGGEMSYKYLDAAGPADKPWRYELTMRFYINPLTDPPEQALTIQIFPVNNIYALPVQRIKVLRTSLTDITVPTLPGCGQATSRMSLALYVTTVNLPVASDGFLARCVTSNRIAGIVNLRNSVDLNMGVEVKLLPGDIPNSSPVFSNIPVAFICAGANSFVANTAYDADGDELVYSYGTFLQNQYASGYSPTQPFGAAGAATINSATGLSGYMSPAQGIFQVAVEVREYRIVNGSRQLLTTAQRDVQVIARTCTATTSRPPTFTPATLTAPRDFTIREGQTLTFNVAVTDPDGDPLTLTATSALLDGPGGIEATFANQPGVAVAANPAGTVSVKGNGTAAGTFRLTGCGLDRRTPYEVVITATDEACNSQTVAATFRITVVRAAFAATISGASQLCSQSRATYTASSSSGLSPLQWTAVGGQILGSNVGPTVQVVWGASSRGEVRVSGTTDLGCPTQAVVFPVSFVPGLLVTGPTTYCPATGTELHYSVPGTGAYQWTITNGSIVNGQGTNEVAVTISPGATAALQVASPALTQCVSTLLIGPDDNCLNFYNVITPNGDGQNDVFTIKNIERRTNTALTIFNRWGQKVYHSDDYHNTFGGEGVNPGVYYYLCRTEDGASYKGWFEVIR